MGDPAPQHRPSNRTTTRHRTQQPLQNEKVNMKPQLKRVTIIAETDDGKISTGIAQILPGGEIDFKNDIQTVSNQYGEPVRVHGRRSVTVTDIEHFTTYRETPAITEAAKELIAALEGR